MNAPHLPPGIDAATAPPIRRTPMPAQPWFGLWRGLLFALWPGLHFPAPAAPAAAWQAAATRRRRVLLALVAALAGSALISLAEARSAISARPFLGNALALAGALAVSGYWLIGRRLRRRLPLVPYVTVVYGTAAALLMAAALLLRQRLSGFAPATYGWFLLLALLPQLLGHSSFNWALGQLPASYVAIATLGEPIGAAVLACAFLGETPTRLKLLAAAMVLAGIFLALSRRKRNAPGG